MQRPLKAEVLLLLLLPVPISLSPTGVMRCQTAVKGRSHPQRLRPSTHVRSERPFLAGIVPLLIGNALNCTPRSHCDGRVLSIAPHVLILMGDSRPGFPAGLQPVNPMGPISICSWQSPLAGRRSRPTRSPWRRNGRTAHQATPRRRSWTGRHLRHPQRRTTVCTHAGF